MVLLLITLFLYDFEEGVGLIGCKLKLPPNHFVDHTHVTLDDAHNLGAHILIHIVRHRDAVVAILDETHSHIDALEQANSVNTTQHKAAFVQSLGALGRGADADGWEGMANAGKEARLLGKGTAVANHAEGVHLKAIVVVET